jgi:hypothetical protein
VPQALQGLGGGQQRVVDMGTIVEFPAGAAVRRDGEGVYAIPREGSATIVILPVVRIERYADEACGDSGPNEKTTRRRRKRRARS